MEGLEGLTKRRSIIGLTWVSIVATRLLFHLSSGPVGWNYDLSSLRDL